MDNLKKIEAFLNMPSDDDMVYGEALTEQVEDNGLPTEIRIPASEFPEYDEYYDDLDGELYTELTMYIEDRYGQPVDFHWEITPDEIIIDDITWFDDEDIEPEVEEQEVDFPEDDVMEDLNEAKLRKNDLTDENLANFKMELQEIKDNLADFGPEGLYAVPYESFKREFPIFTEKVIESFLDEMGDDGEGDWQEGELIWENDWPCLIEGAEKLLNGKGFQWEKIYTKHYKPANESLNESSSRKDNIDIIEKELEADFYGLTLEDYYEDEDTLMISIRDSIGEIYDISIKKSELGQPGGLSYILFNELDLAIERGDVTEDRPVDESLKENAEPNKFCTKYKVGDKVKFIQPGGRLSNETATITGYDAGGNYTYTWDDGSKSSGCSDFDFVKVGDEEELDYYDYYDESLTEGAFDIFKKRPDVTYYAKIHSPKMSGTKYLYTTQRNGSNALIDYLYEKGLEKGEDYDLIQAAKNPKMAKELKKGHIGGARSIDKDIEKANTAKQAAKEKEEKEMAQWKKEQAEKAKEGELQRQYKAEQERQKKLSKAADKKSSDWFTSRQAARNNKTTYNSTKDEYYD